MAPPSKFNMMNQEQRREFLELSPISGTYPPPYENIYEGAVPTEWDSIVIERISAPLAEPPTAGTELDVDKQKGHGTDYEQIIGKGYRAVPVEFTLLLWKDLRTGTDWIKHYDDKLRDRLMPKRLDKRNAIEVYHPSLSGDGITTVVILKRDVPKHVGKQFWQVRCEGIDLRTSSIKSGSATKKMKQDTKLTTTATAIGKSGGGPAAAKKGTK